MKTNILKALIILMILIPAYSYAEDTGGTDMGLFSNIIGYIFFALVALMFGILIYHSTHPKVYIPKTVTASDGIISEEYLLEGSFIPMLNRIYYAVFALMFLWAVILITYIF